MGIHCTGRSAAPAGGAWKGIAQQLALQGPEEHSGMLKAVSPVQRAENLHADASGQALGLQPYNWF